MTHPRTPRQTPGEDLVPVTFLLPRPIKAALQQRAAQEQRSVSQLGRRVLELYLTAGGWHVTETP